MITTIRQKLEELGKVNCEHNSLSFQEKGKGVKLTPSSNGEAIKIRVDDQSKNSGLPGLITDSARCDCLYFYQQPSRRHIFLVELKGNNYRNALTQLEATKNHKNYADLYEVAKNVALFDDAVTGITKPFEETAVAIVSKWAKINNPRKDEWEKEHNLRLRVEPLDDNQTYELRNLIKDLSIVGSLPPFNS